MPKFLTNQIKLDEVLPNLQKAGAFGTFAFNQFQGGGILPTSALSDISVRFGGDGSDGPLNIISGTTTVDLGSAKVVIKNYNSIAITGTGALNFSSPHSGGTVVILKSKSNVKLTSSATALIDLRGMGATGGTGGAVPNANGTVGTQGNFILGTGVHGGNNTGPTAAGGVILQSLDFYAKTTTNFFNKTVYVACGSGGGGGQGGDTGGGAGGAGGRGGGVLIIE